MITLVVPILKILVPAALALLLARRRKRRDIKDLKSGKKTLDDF